MKTEDSEIPFQGERKKTMGVCAKGVYLWTITLIHVCPAQPDVLH